MASTAFVNGLLLASCTQHPQQLTNEELEVLKRYEKQAKENGYCHQDDEGFTVCFAPLENIQYNALSGLE